jgi:hypothetical protein
VSSTLAVREPVSWFVSSPVNSTVLN